MENLSKKRKIAIGVIIAIIVLTLGFIWGNSLKTVEQSSESSGKVYETVKTVVDAVFGEDVVPVTHTSIRKLAHYTEFTVLGAEMCALFIALKRESFKGYLHVLPYGVFVASVDECLQFLSGRGPALTDVLIDFCGYLFATAIFFAVFMIRRKRAAKKPRI